MLRRGACHDGFMDAVNVDTVLARFAEHWSPRKIAQINDYDVRIVKVQGEFTWHQHAESSPSSCAIATSCSGRGNSS